MKLQGCGFQIWGILAFVDRYDGEVGSGRHSGGGSLGRRGARRQTGADIEGGYWQKDQGSYSGSQWDNNRSAFVGKI